MFKNFKSIIDSALEDLSKRFERFNDVTRSFECIYKVLDLKESNLEQYCEKLAQAYCLSFPELISQLRLFRCYMSSKK